MAGARLRDGVALDEVVGVLLADGRQRRQLLVGVHREPCQHVVLVGEDGEDPVRVPASAGLARRMTSLRSLPAAREAGAEFVEDDRQALAFGQAVDVVEQVRVDRAVGVLTGQELLAGAFVPARDLVQRGRQRRAFHARLGRQAVDELLAEQRLRADRAARVGAEALKPGLLDLSTTAAFCCGVGVTELT